MRWIDGDRRKEWVHLTLVVQRRRLTRHVVHLIPLQYADARRTQRRQQLLVPAQILLGHKAMHHCVDRGQGLLQGGAVGSGLGITVFNPLQYSGHADLDKLIQVAGGDGQKL